MSDEDHVMRTDVPGSLTLINYSCRHDDISAAFGVQPSATWDVGDLMPSGRRAYKTKG